MKYTLKRLNDNKKSSGNILKIINKNTNCTNSLIHSNKPLVGYSVLIISLFGKSKYNQDIFLTEPVEEIIKEIKTENTHYVRFKTQRYEYEWWVNDQN